MSQPRLEKRHLHFNLSNSPAGVQHTLHLGHRRFELQPHDDQSRAALLDGPETLFQYIQQHLPGYLTHYHPEVEVSAETIQSYWISHPSLFGRPYPALAGCGIMIPKAVAKRAHVRLGYHRGLFSGKARHLGLVGPLPPPMPKVRRGPFGDPEAVRQASVLAAAAEAQQPDPPVFLGHGDLADYHDHFTDAAAFLVYHHSNLFTLSFSHSESGSDTAVQILAIIEATPSFDALAMELRSQGYEQDLEHSKSLEGFANAEPWERNGHPVSHPKTGKPLWWWVPTARTLKAMKPVVQEALQAVNDRPDLDGVSFKIDHGRHSVTLGGSAPAPAAPAPAELPLVTHPKPAISPHPPKTLASAAPGGYSWQLGDPDYHHGRQIVLGVPVDRTISFTLNNSYFRHLGVFLRFLDQKGEPIPLKSLGSERPAPTQWDTEYDVMVNWVTSRGRFMGIPTQEAASTLTTVTLPASAASMMILAGGMGVGSVEKTYWGVQGPGAVQTAALDLGLPTMLLGFGVAADAVLGACSVMVFNLATSLATSSATKQFLDTMPAGNVTDSSAYTNWACKVWQAILFASPDKVLDLLECLTPVITSETLLELIPIAGQILLATNIAATAADLTETTTDVLLSPQIIPDLLTSTLNIDVAVAKAENDYQFPASATRMAITLTLTGSIAYSATIDLHRQYPGYPTPTPMSLNHTFTHIPSGGQAQVDVKLFAEDGWVAAVGSWSGPNLLHGHPAVQANITLIENVRPLTRTTQYEHLRVLRYDSQTNPQHHQWFDAQKTPPTATVANLNRHTAQALCALGGISINMTGHVGYSWSKVSGDRQILSTAQVINVGGGGPDKGLRILVSGSNQAGYDMPVFLVEDLLGPANGLHFIVAPVGSGSSREYHAFRIELDGDATIDLSKCKSWGRFASTKLDAICVHPRGFLLALNSLAETVELLHLPSKPYEQLSDALYATYTGGQGSYVGRLHGATAIAATKDGNGFLVLEAVNKRIQVFSVNGTSIPGYFDLPGDHPWIDLEPLDRGQTIDYLSMAVEDTGFIYVLSAVDPGALPSDYRLDIFEPAGKHLSRTIGVPAAQLTVDKFRVVYTENYELIIGPNQRPEPSISEWIASSK